MANDPRKVKHLTASTGSALIELALRRGDRWVAVHKSAANLSSVVHWRFNEGSEPVVVTEMMVDLSPINIPVFKARAKKFGDLNGLWKAIKAGDASALDVARDYALEHGFVDEWLRRSAGVDPVVVSEDDGVWHSLYAEAP